MSERKEIRALAREISQIWEAIKLSPPGTATDIKAIMQFRHSGLAEREFYAAVQSAALRTHRAST